MNEFIPTEFFLSQNYPNPFKEKTLIKYCIAYKTKVKLTIYDEKHNEIKTLVDEEKQPGTYEVEFSARHSREGGDLLGVERRAKDNMYYYNLEAEYYKCEKKMELIE